MLIIFRCFLRVSQILSPNVTIIIIIIIIIAWHYNSGRVLAFSTIPFHLRRSRNLFCPFYEFHHLQVVPDIVFPSGIGSSYWSSCESFPFVYFLYNTSFRHSIYVSKPTQSLGFNIINHLTPNGHYMGRTAQLTSRRYILYIYSTNIRTEYFKHAA